ncbi:sugar MFS transporter [Lewinella sp. W8]|uniref:MFS transporter n=1 Tax=Lewinella sp. W8 TaxID=2528208 RepID=UPI0010678455|nr:MFS transporter [Lewinella sp. W8]MTB49530.1 MFS transporter [Lewinella sp. W8]
MSSSSSAAPAGVPANRDRLFLASCVALIVTSMTFAIRAGILGDLSVEFGLSDSQLGWVNSMAFYGFPLAMLIGGAIYNQVGPRNLMWIAFISHILGLVLTMTAGGFWGLIISTFFIGFANGSVEAACNPLIADMYPDKQTEMLNKFHVWFPGGIVIGSLVTFALGDSVSWQVLIATMLIPTAIYGILIFGQKFPKTENIVGDTKTNLSGVFSGLFIVVALLMTMTATTEFGATQWVERILGNAGANAMILLAMTAGIMATGRFFAGPLVHRLNPVGVLIGSAVLACLGLFMLSQVTGPMVYLGTAVFALGICYFWPTMLGFTAEYIPKSGALGLSLIGGAGMLGAGIWNPIIGGWIDSGREEALAMGLSGEAAELATGQATLGSIAYFPAILIVCFIALYFYMRNRPKVSAADVILDADVMATPGSAR